MSKHFSRIARTTLAFCFAVAACMGLSGCGVYSFTGASIPPEAKTVSVAYFQNMAQEVMPTLSNTFTDALKDKFIRQTRLSLVRSEGDFAFEGEVKSYVHGPIAITGEQQAAKERLTVSVRVKFTSRFTPKSDFDKQFSAYADYETTQSFASVERTLVAEIVEKLVEDIFNASAASW